MWGGGDWGWRGCPVLTSLLFPLPGCFMSLGEGDTDVPFRPVNSIFKVFCVFTGEGYSILLLHLLRSAPPTKLYPDH